MHPNQRLKIKVFQLHDKNGRWGFQTKDLQITPCEFLNCKIVIDNNTVTIQSSENTERTESHGHLKYQSIDRAIKSPCEKKGKSSECVKPEMSDNEQSLFDCIPDVLDEMKKCGHVDTWVKLNKMLANKEFPLNNIAFLLFMDVCKFMSLENSCSMRYSDKVKQFWRIGFKLFHGKWLRFMGGPKHTGEIISGESEKGYFRL